ncbi:MAG TPA: FtsX-like permease family protein, partial [Sphingobacteriaceae bacterium]|nr:FtsX-like permease family protein [Sphingobacteriaceae bacterium]
TARSLSRAKEVSIRKILGTEKKALISQFLTESCLTTVLSLFIALLIVIISLEGFNSISGKQIPLSALFQPVTIISLLTLSIVVGILAGLYPALVIAEFKPLQILKSKIGGGFRKDKFRSSLVVFQFLTSIILIIGTMVIFRQLDYIQNKEVGFDKDQVVVIRNTNMLPNGAEIFRQRVTDLTGITSSSFASYLPVSNSSRSDYAISTDAALSEEKIFNAQIWNIDYDYIPTLGIQLQEGRNFAREFGQDSTGMLINETAARMMGLENPLGHNLFMPNIDGSISTYTIIGVIENFHFESLRHHIGPLCMRLGNNQGSVAFKISSTDLQGLMGQIEQRWAAMSTELPFSYHFLDESFDAMYHTEQRVGRVSMIFSILAIIIACLGLFGLTTFMVEQRVKEIGVRKVLGASVQGIITLISKDFLKLIIIAILIAMPLSWWTMNNWLANFAYRTELTWWVFASAGLLALIIALLTVSWQAIRAALTNPVDSLRDE